MKTQEILTVLNPRGTWAKTTTTINPAPKLLSLRGKTIGILNNTKRGGEVLIPHIERTLHNLEPDMILRHWRIPLALPEEQKLPVLQEIAAECDGVFALLGD